MFAPVGAPRPRRQVAERCISKEWATCQPCPRGCGRTVSAMLFLENYNSRLTETVTPNKLSDSNIDRIECFTGQCANYINISASGK